MRRGWAAQAARVLRALLVGALLLLSGALPACRGRENGGAGHRLARPQVLPPGVLPWVGRVAIDWNRGGAPRERIVIGPGGLEMGPIEGPLTRYLFSDRSRADDVDLFVRSYAPFTVREKGEELTFRGVGTAAAGPAERRMLVLWAHQVAAEAVGGRGGEAYGTVLSWHRSGDAGGECSELVVALTGEVRAGPCGAASWTGRLADEPLRRIYSWFDAWGPFQSGAEDGQPGAPPVRVVFAGHGPASPSAGERAAVAAFAGSLFRELAARHPAPPPPVPPKPAPAPGAPAGKPAPKPAPPPPPVPEPAGPRLLRPEVPAAHEPPPVVAPATPPPAPAPAAPPPPPG